MFSLHRFRGVEQLPDAVGQLFAAAGGAAGFCCTPQWFRHLAASTSTAHREPCLYVLHDGDAPCLLLPMLAPAGRRFWQARRLSAMGNFYTPLSAPLSLLQGRPRVTALAAWATAMTAGEQRWDSIDLHPLATDDGWLEPLVSAMRAAGMAVQTYFCFGNWYLPVAGRSFQGVFDGLPARLRNTITRKRRQLDAAARLRLDVISNEEQLPAALAAYQQIYAASWKQPEPYPEFIPGLMRLCAREGWLRLGIAYVDGQPAAAQLWIVRDGVASIYKLAYDQRFAALSVGSILSARLMQQAIDVDRVHEIDYLNGDEPYKQDWMSHRRERWGVRAFNLRSAHGLAGAALHLGGRWARSLLTRYCQRPASGAENIGPTGIYARHEPNVKEPMV